MFAGSKTREAGVQQGNRCYADILKTAITAGYSAKYIPFDNRFSNSKDIIRIHSERSMNTIAMIKKSSKVFYEFKRKQMNVKQIFETCKKRRGHFRYLLSVSINISLKSGKSLSSKIICIHNQNKKKERIAFICTDTNLSEKEIFGFTGKRWKISRSPSKHINPC